MTKYKVERVITNKAQCRQCNDIIESTNRHDFKSCKCGAISVDGGKEYLKRCFKNYNDIIELSETYTEEVDL